MSRQARESERLVQRSFAPGPIYFALRIAISLPEQTGSAMVVYSRAALTSMNSSGDTLQAAGEEAFQVAPSA
jgi:hypothetical protein